MPDSVQHSSSEGFVFLRHSLLASRVPLPQPQLASLTEYPPSLVTEQQHNGALAVGQRPRRGVGQDKGAPDSAPLKAKKLAPVTNVARFSLQDSSAGHEKNLHAAKERKVRGSIWMQPKVKLAMLHIAKLNGDSFSEAC